MFDEVTRQRGIKGWSLEDRPREKLLLKGRSSLSESELIAVLIRSGVATSNAVDISRQLLQSVGYNLNALAKLSVQDLMKQKGIGLAKAVAIVAAMELGRRRACHGIEKRYTITGSQDAFDFIKRDFLDLDCEEFWIILLNKANGVIRKQNISKGGVSATVVDPKIIYKVALEELASGLIVAHNHPSGNLKPSKTDVQLTKRLKEVGLALEVSLLDHLIIGEKNYLSFADKGFL